MPLNSSVIVRISGLAITLVFLSGCPSRAYVPPEALAPQSLQLSDALLEFSKKTQSEQLAKYRRSAREDLMRSAVLDFFKGNDWSREAFEQGMPKPRDLLCLPRYGYLRISGPAQNISGRATAVKTLIAPPSDDTLELIKSLGKSYSVDITKVEVPDDYATWIVGAGEPCDNAVRNADPFATRSYIGKESLIATTVAAKAAFEVIWGVIKPAVDGTLQNVDLERRNHVIQEYFANKDNVNDFKRDIQHLESFLKSEFELEQRRTAGIAVVAQADAFESRQFDAALAVAKKNDCKKNIQRLVDLKTDPQGAACMGAVFAVLTPSFNTALDAADKFDVSIEKQLPKVTLSSQVKTLSEIAQGKNPAEEQAKAFWATLLRYATLYNTVKETSSDENNEKLDAALDAFRESLKSSKKGAD